jgi:branched-chain amino acid aminotransferase
MKPTNYIEDGYAYFNGQIVPMADAKVSIATHALNYGTGCFEGIRAYWNKDQEQMYALKLREHYERIEQSCRILKITLPISVNEMVEVTKELLKKNDYKQDVYIRPLAYKSAPVIKVGLTGLEDAFNIFCAPMGDYVATTGLHLGVSSWRRLDDNAVPSRGKVTGSYINAALAVDDLQQSGFDDGIMLTADGHVAEATSANMFMVRDGKLITTPVSDSILEGITRKSVLELALNENIPVEVRTIDRTELYVADEIFLCGTGVQVAPVIKVDHRPVGTGKSGDLTLTIQRLYFDAVRGVNKDYQSWLTPVYE